jgi:hypothetical protein
VNHEGESTRSCQAASFDRRRKRTVSGERSLELHLAHVHRCTSAGRLRGIHRAEHLASGLHVLRALEVLKDHRRSLCLIDEISRPVAGTSGGGPSDSSMRARSSCIRSADTSVNLTARTYIKALLDRGIPTIFGPPRPVESADLIAPERRSAPVSRFAAPRAGAARSAGSSPSGSSAARRRTQSAAGRRRPRGDRARRP